MTEIRHAIFPADEPAVLDIWRQFTARCQQQRCGPSTTPELVAAVWRYLISMAG